MTFVERLSGSLVLVAALAAGVGMSVLLGGYLVGLTVMAGVFWMLAGALRLALRRSRSRA